MFRLWMLMLVCACGCLLTLPSTHTLADDEEKATKIFQAFETEVKLEPDSIKNQTVAEVLEKLSKAHGIEFVIREEEFKVAGIDNFKNRKSVFQAVDTKGLKVTQFLNVWLASVGATWRPERTRIAIVPAPRWNEKAGEFDKEDRTAIILTALADHEVAIPKGNINDIPLLELLSHLSGKHGLTFVINEESFKEAGIPNVKEDKPNLAITHFGSLHLHQFLRVMLGSMGATYLVRNNTIEIVSVQYAAKVTKATMKPTDNKEARSQLSEPLVSFIVKEKPLNETATKIAEMYDLTVIVSPQAGEARTGPISARLLNMPAEQAIEMLALQADLRVIRKANAFLITSKKHASELMAEELEERQKLELKKLREPVKPPTKQPSDLIPLRNLPSAPEK